MATKSNIQEHILWLNSSHAYMPTISFGPPVGPGLVTMPQPVARPTLTLSSVPSPAAVPSPITVTSVSDLSAAPGRVSPAPTTTVCTTRPIGTASTGWENSTVLPQAKMEPGLSAPAANRDYRPPVTSAAGSDHRPSNTSISTSTSLAPTSNTPQSSAGSSAASNVSHSTSTAGLNNEKQNYPLDTSSTPAAIRLHKSSTPNPFNTPYVNIRTVDLCSTTDNSLATVTTPTAIQPFDEPSVKKRKNESVTPVSLQKKARPSEIEPLRYGSPSAILSDVNIPLDMMDEILEVTNNPNTTSLEAPPVPKLEQFDSEPTPGVVLDSPMIIDSDDDISFNGRLPMDDSLLDQRTPPRREIKAEQSPEPPVDCPFPQAPTSPPSKPPSKSSRTSNPPKDPHNFHDAIKQCLQQAEEERKEAAFNFAEYVQKFSDVCPTKQAALETAKKKVDTLTGIPPLYDQITSLAERKTRIEEEIIASVRAGHNKETFVSSLDENFRTQQQILSLKSRIDGILSSVGLAQYAFNEAPPAILEPTPSQNSYQANFVVKSTQDQPHLPAMNTNPGFRDNDRSDGSPLLIASSPSFEPHRNRANHSNHSNHINDNRNSFGPSVISNTAPPTEREESLFVQDDYQDPFYYNDDSPPPPPPPPPPQMPQMPQMPQIQSAAAVPFLNPTPVAQPGFSDPKRPLHTNKTSITTVTTNSKYAKMNFPWSDEVNNVMKGTFKMNGFRPHQLEAINTTLSGRDVFVLMPTGGGKSLCYQVPAIVTAGSTSGITIVVSPLLSLMEDQVMHLRNKNVSAFLLSGDVSKDERNEIYSYLRSDRPQESMQLLYITPEMLTKNVLVVDMLKELHERGQFARLVIDEAHCVSQWGHDFRPDYKAIGPLRQQFPGVPLMALTATATNEVEGDVRHNLAMESCEIFRQSFNRPNLIYEVRKKGSPNSVLEGIAELIKQDYKNLSGIIYCLSRRKCEEVAGKLRSDYSIRAQHYHAKMEIKDKRKVQLDWQRGRSQVIVATIAFGMGIDKPDVRFVIHHTLPKSLEGYYQETGRAGRDGRVSRCILYYAFTDFPTIKRMIDGSLDEQLTTARTYEEKKLAYMQRDRQLRMLNQVTVFCENQRDCRRAQVLEYFGESFLREMCRETCDNCKSKADFEDIDVIDHAKNAVAIVGKLQHENVGLMHCVDVFRGSKANRLLTKGHNKISEFGSGSSLDREVAMRLFQKLFRDGYFQEVNIVNKSGFPNQYLVLSNDAEAAIRRQTSYMIDVEVKGKKSKSKAPTSSLSNDPPFSSAIPVSTNIPSPSRGGNKYSTFGAQRLPQQSIFNKFVVDDAEAAAQFDFPPIRDAGHRRNPPRGVSTLGQPISMDEKMSRLTPVHRDIVENFVREGQELCQKLLLERELRSVPFSDTLLRDMAIAFPQNTDEMRAIPGMDPLKVDAFGNLFLPIIQRYRSFYENALEGSQEAEVVYDPNHQNVINLDSDGPDIEDGFDCWSDGDEAELIEEIGLSRSQQPAQSSLPQPVETGRTGPAAAPIHNNNAHPMGRSEYFDSPGFALDDVDIDECMDHFGPEPDTDDLDPAWDDANFVSAAELNQPTSFDAPRGGGSGGGGTRKRTAARGRGARKTGGSSRAYGRSAASSSTGAGGGGAKRGGGLSKFAYSGGSRSGARASRSTRGGKSSRGGRGGGSIGAMPT